MRINKDYMMVMRSGKYLNKAQQQMAMENQRKAMESAILVGICMLLAGIILILALVCR